MAPSKSIPYRAAAWTLWVLIALFFYARGLDWGTPSTRKSIALFGSLGPNSGQAREMLASRTALYEGYEKALAGQPSAEGPWIYKSRDQFLKPWEEIPVSLKLSLMRGYLIGVPSDDQQTLAVMSRFDPFQGHWDTGNYSYGLFYFFSLGIFSVTGFLFGFLPWPLPIETLLNQPDTVARIYLLIRAYSAFLWLSSALLLYKLARQEEDIRWPFAWMASLLMLLSPLGIINSHMAKPHTLGAFLILTSFCCFRSELTARSSSKRFNQASFLIGLSAAAAFTNLIAYLTAPLILWFRQGRSLIHSQTGRYHLFASFLSFLIGAVLFNPFYYLRFDRFYRKFYAVHVQIFHHGLLEHKRALSFFFGFFQQGYPWMCLPFVAYGAWRIHKTDNRWGKVLCGLVLCYFIFDILLMRHEGVLIPIIPLLSWLFAFGAQHAWDRWRKAGSGGFLLVVFMVFLFFFSVQNDLHLMSRFGRSGNLTLAGEWMNSHMGRGSPIGIINGNINPSVVPPFRMLDHPLITIPAASQEWREELLPLYLITPQLVMKEDLPAAVSHFYRPVFHRRLDTPENIYHQNNENEEITLWQKKVLPHE